MCGRYAASKGAQWITEAYDAVDETGGELVEDYNVAPTKPVPAVLARVSKEEPEQVLRQLRVLRWGLVPSWAKDLSIGARLINARAETLVDKPAFRKAFAKRRCLLPADGFYEWVTDDGVKQPYFFARPDGEQLSMAGLYEIWRDPADPESPLVWSCTVITTQAADDVGHVHDRAPMTVPPELWDDWLDPRLTDLERLPALLVPSVSGALVTRAVSTRVNSVRNNGPELLEPVDPVVALDEEPGADRLF